ncbi:ketopantoate hydroxymethyltransferase-domain-containing protein [Amylocarpus encephaloides]|uniref:3-methyl-2-oxobutanoate hydroxymethyltransferase n=1 Tax=Amylocarpus encephaloides TaxID=45428 RepID=A0A9P8C7P7_9HELO|nr:ketopantoate hydroxymethyltransferase-domain-containing protein [Amylocarpus encephaloides]
MSRSVSIVKASRALLAQSKRPASFATRPLASQWHARNSSHSPMGSVGGSLRKKVTLNTIRATYKKGEPITVLTAHDFPSGHVADAAGMEIVLVGDSLAMVAMGMDDTSEVLLEEMLLHCRSVARAAKSSFLVGDLPMGCYEIAPEQALESAIRVIKEGRVHSVKLEGGIEMAPSIKKITSAGIPVLGHVGLTPQRQNSLGGFRVQGKTAASAMRVLKDALAVQEAGAFAMVMEAVPAEIAALITRKLSVPTIGIGAGSGCSGQVLVQIDMTGNFPPGRFIPKFVKKYGDVWSESLRAIESYKDETKSRAYPAPEHTYQISKEELAEFERNLEALELLETLLHPKENTLSLSPTLNFFLNHPTTVSKRCVLVIVTTAFVKIGAEPTALKCTVTLGFGKSPAWESAEVASRGREVRMMEEAMVRGRSGSWVESGMAFWVSEGDGDGGWEDMFGRRARNEKRVMVLWCSCGIQES